MKFLLGVVFGILGGVFLSFFINFTEVEHQNVSDESTVTISSAEPTLEPSNIETNSDKKNSIIDKLSNKKFKKVYSLLQRNYYQPEDITDEKIEEWLIQVCICFYCCCYFLSS